MFSFKGRCENGHAVLLLVDDDGLVLQPDECRFCAMPVKISRFGMWWRSKRLLKKARKELGEIIVFDPEDWINKED